MTQQNIGILSGNIFGNGSSISIGNMVMPGGLQINMHEKVAAPALELPIDVFCRKVFHHVRLYMKKNEESFFDSREVKNELKRVFSNKRFEEYIEKVLTTDEKHEEAEKNVAAAICTRLYNMEKVMEMELERGEPKPPKVEEPKTFSGLRSADMELKSLGIKPIASVYPCFDLETSNVKAKFSKWAFTDAGWEDLKKRVSMEEVSTNKEFVKYTLYSPESFTIVFKTIEGLAGFMRNVWAANCVDPNKNLVFGEGDDYPSTKKT